MMRLAGGKAPITWSPNPGTGAFGLCWLAGRFRKARIAAVALARRPADWLAGRAPGPMKQTVKSGRSLLRRRRANAAAPPGGAQTQRAVVPRLDPFHKLCSVSGV